TPTTKMKNRFTLAIKPAVIATALLFITAIPAYATTIFVTNTNDSGPGSLRQALSIANDGDTIDATGVSGTILLTSGELQVTHNVTINGPGDATLADHGHGGGIFSTNATLTLTNSTLSGNSAGTGGGIFYNGGGTLTVINSIISGNSANSAGGGMGSGLQGTTIATVRDSTISGNSA